MNLCAKQLTKKLKGGLSLEASGSYVMVVKDNTAKENKFKKRETKKKN